MDAESITLPGGFERDGRWRRTVWLRPLTGRDEMLFAEAGESGGQPAAVTALLARTMCLDAEGPPVGPAFARALTLGDREAVLLHLRRITLGDRLGCVLGCPACGAKLDLDVHASAILVPPYPHDGRSHRTTIEDGGATYAVRFRLPTGADQESVATLALHDAEAAAAAVVDRCVQDLSAAHGTPVASVPALREPLASVMAELDPQAAVDLAAVCPECGASFLALLDAAEFLRQELTLTSDALFREVHLLAWHYHWGEADILALPRRRRRRYLGYLAEAAMAGGR